MGLRCIANGDIPRRSNPPPLTDDSTIDSDSNDGSRCTAADAGSQLGESILTAAVVACWHRAECILPPPPPAGQCLHRATMGGALFLFRVGCRHRLLCHMLPSYPCTSPLPPLPDSDLPLARDVFMGPLSMFIGPGHVH